MSRRATVLPILLGAATGAAFALVGVEPTSSSALSEAPQAESPPQPTSAEPPAVVPDLPSPDSSGPQAPNSAAGNGRPAEAAATADSSAKVPSPVFNLPDLLTKEALLAAQVRCNQKSPEHCEQAAEALDEGALAAKDPVRANMLRRIALTLYVKQCETGRPASCARLSEMYEHGIVVKANARSANALRDRVVTLCKTKSEESICR